jgi:hypothetical protein
MDVEYGPLVREAIRRLEEECGPPTARHRDPGYYAQRICSRTEKPPNHTPKLARAFQLWKNLPLPLNTVEGWVVVYKVQRAMIAAVDQDDVDAERAEQARALLEAAQALAEEGPPSSVSAATGGAGPRAEARAPQGERAAKNNKRYMNAAESAAYLGITLKCFRRRVDRGIYKPLRGRKRQKRLYFTEESLKRDMEGGRS